MLTQHEVRKQLDTIANEVAQPEGVYYELFSRLYSQRVQRWILTAPRTDAILIQRVAENDPDYLADIELADTALLAARPVPHDTLFNPAWDLDY